ncbi:unnamed protein product [Haemonchus placei]|uniref:Thioredoxin domain-containing protein n=1 Tax=Haemonchus placei TaxID=6290 RepID=A0A158QKX1_HAEPC|nr:unnamed protein product [Haemonchus placei]
MASEEIASQLISANLVVEWMQGGLVLARWIMIFVEFTGRFFSNQALREYDTDWWVRRPAAPHAKHLEQLVHLINDRSEHYTFVLYYQPDGYDNFAAYYACSELFHSGDARGLVVDCSEEKEICKQQAVETTPTLIVYSTGKAYKQYPHAIDTFLIKDWVKTVQNPIITKLSEDSVPYYREGIVPGFDSPRASVIMFFAATRDSDTFRNYERFARERHGDFHLTELVDRSIEKWAHQPAFVAMKPLEKLSRANTLYEGITYESMVEFAEENLHPSIGCVFTREITNENETELELWLRNVKDNECEHATTVDMNILVSLRNWEREENLRRLLRNKDALDHHEEL